MPTTETKFAKDSLHISTIMNPTRPTNDRRHEESRSACNDSHSILRSRTEEERLRRRRLEWQRQQERERQYEKLKQRKILEYERKRAQALGYPEPKSVHHSRSQSSSNSPQYRHRGRSSTSASKSGTLEKLEGFTSGTIPFFKSSDEGIQYNITELRRIKFDIRRNIPVKGPIPELQQSIVNAEDIILIRREGEGAKPIFDRKEIKECAKMNKLDERPTVAVIDEEYQSAKDSVLHISTIMNPTRPINDRQHEESRSARNEDHDSHSILRSRTEEERLRRRRLEWQRQQERERQHEKLKQQKILEYERKRAQALGYPEPKSVHHSRSKSRKGSKPLFHREEIKKAAEINEVEERSTVTVIDEEYRSDLTDKSQTYKKRSSSSSPILYGSEYLASHKFSRTSRIRSLIEERSYRGRYRDKSSKHSRERKDRGRDRDRDRFRERRDVASHYIEPPIHVPISYNPPRLIVYPIFPFRGVPPMRRGQHSNLIALNKSLPPRFIPPNM